MRRVAAALLGLTVLMAAAAFWLRGEEPAPPPAPPPPRAAQPAARPEPPEVPPTAPSVAVERVEPRAPAGGEPEPVPETPDGYPERVEDPTGDLGLYERRPMSAVPHQVVRGWGAGGAGEVPGLVGVYAVVDPEIDDAELERMGRDMLRYHDDATVVSVKVFDSEHAAVYDRHTDGGALAQAHLVATFSRNRDTGTERIVVRGKVIDEE